MKKLLIFILSGIVIFFACFAVGIYLWIDVSVLKPEGLTIFSRSS